jgi:hypothetical protein
MASKISKFRRARALRLVVVVAMLMLASVTSASSASATEWRGKLPAKTWAAKGEYRGIIFLTGTKTAGTGPVCVTAAEYSGGWSFPYGWDCSATASKPMVIGGAGYPAADNPNSDEIAFLVEIE